MLFTLFSSICLCFADDFLIIYLAIEIQSLSFYVFATFNRLSEFNTESGLKYFIFGSVISCLLLFGFVFIYVNLGITTFELLFSVLFLTTDYFIISGIVFIMIAFLFKTGAAPFHIWLCDVYEGSLLSVTLMFSSLPKIILFGLITKLFHFIFIDIFMTISNLFLLSSIASICIGSIAAIYQKRIKRLLGYSTINHTGFILLAIAIPSMEATKILSFYIIIYTTLTLLLFALLIYCSISTKKSYKYLTN
jgi:NADH-quinone oxidoreductase subunit N